MVVFQYKLSQHFSQFLLFWSKWPAWISQEENTQHGEMHFTVKWSVKVVICLTFVLKCLENLQAPQCGHQMY
jgi:hypothetical protein